MRSGTRLLLFGRRWTPARLGMDFGKVEPAVNVWKDAAGSTAAAVATDPVRKWLWAGPAAANFTNGADAARPLLTQVGGKWCLRFDGGNDFLQATYALGSPYTVGIAGGWQTLARTMLVDGKTDFSLGAYRENDTFLTLFDGATRTTTYVPVAATMFRAVFVHDGSALTVYVNGAVVYGPTADGAMTLAGLTLASNGGNVGFNAAVDVYAGTTLGAAVTAGVVARLDGWLAGALP